MTQPTKNLLGPRIFLYTGILYTALISVALLSSTAELPRVETIFLDKIVHIVLHFFLFLIWAIYFSTTKNKVFTGNPVLWSFLCCLLYGIIIELLQQQFTTTRQADILDVAANTIGSILGIVVFLKIKDRIKRKI
ncbi:VanZ family protein [Constantimarinum furrinae]|uniref:Integral membrane protein n=1 Tax=Constantimarinum furrinae TaxID=2562285 RepID=A0A7G8PU05_9FLAO|nr:Putative integral membrane protein [Constantimarinum furrinae]